MMGDLFVLNKNYERIGLIEKFESFIWAERYNKVGDFKLSVPNNSRRVDDLITGKYLEFTESRRLMQIYTVEEDTSNPKRNHITAQGKSMEDLLNYRAWSYRPGAEDDANRKFSGSPGNIAVWGVRDICITRPGSTRSGYDIIDGLTDITNIPGMDSISISINTTDKLLKVVKDLLDPEDIGFRMVFDPNLRTFTFEVYQGRDFTSQGGATHPLVFGADFDNLFNGKRIRTEEDHYNVAYMYHPSRPLEARIVYPWGVDPLSRVGNVRRVIAEDASDIKRVDGPDTYDFNAELDSRGRALLAKHRRKDLFDGEARLGTNMDYGKYYEVGDLVEMRDKDGTGFRARVDEHIWTYDSTGLKSYPTLRSMEEL